MPETKKQNYNLSFYNEIRKTANIVNVIGKYVKLRRKGANYFGLCPFHNDTHPSLVVNPRKQIYKCFVCQAKGDVISFVAKKENLTYYQAALKLAEEYNLEIPNNLAIKQIYTDKELRLINANERVNLFFTGFIDKDKYPELAKYLEERKVNDEILAQFQIGYAPEDPNLIKNLLTNKDNVLGEGLPIEKKFNEAELKEAGLLNENLNFVFKNRLTFPIYDENNKLVAFAARDITNKEPVKYLSTETTSIFEKSKILYNFNNVKKEETNNLLIVEGFMDVVGYYKAGYKQVVATMGTTLTDDQINLLKSIPKLKNITLSYDNDSAGMYATISNGQKLLDHGFNVNVVNYKTYEVKDIDELIDKYSQEDVKSIIKDRKDFITYNIESNFKYIETENDKKLVTDLATDFVAQNAKGFDLHQYKEDIARCSGYKLEDISKVIDKKRNDEYKKANLYNNFIDGTFNSKSKHSNYSLKNTVTNIVAQAICDMVKDPNNKDITPNQVLEKLSNKIDNLTCNHKEEYKRSR